MTAYQPPSKEELKQDIYHLMENYKKSGNFSRLEDIHFLTFVSSTFSHEELLSACIFVLEKIESEYIWRDPSHSKLYCLLQKALRISEQNYLDNAVRFTYLIKFLSIIKTRPILKNITDTSILYVKTQLICNTLIKKLQPAINIILKNPPSEKALRYYFKKLPEEYNKISYDKDSKSFFLVHEKERDVWCKIIAIFANDNASSSLCCGLLLHFMLQIEMRYYTSSAKNSDFYKLCCKTLNIDSTKELNIALKSLYLADLQSYISSLLAEKDQVTLLKQYHFVSYPKKYLEYLHDQISDEMYEFKYSTDHGFGSTRLNSYINSLELCAAQYGVTLALTGSIHWVISNVKLSHIPYAILPEYFMTLAVLLFLEKQFKVNVVSFVSKQLAPLATNIIKIPLQITFNNIFGLTNFAHDLKNALNTITNNQSFIEALYEAPDTVFSKENKEKLEMIYDFSREEGIPSYEEVEIKMYEPIEGKKDHYFNH